MANRAYLYTHHPNEDPEYRDLAEWSYEVPIAHLLLVGADPAPCSSAIWQVDARIAIQGDAEQSHPVFIRFLRWLEPKLPEGFHAAAREARTFLARPDRQGRHYHLELGEVYDAMGLSLEEMEKHTRANAALAQELFEETNRLLDAAAATLADVNHPRLKGLSTSWFERLGLRFSDVLYHHLGD